MTTKDEALKQALEALEFSSSYLNELSGVLKFSKKAKPGSTAWHVQRAIKACREALAQKDEHEPVAEITADDMGRPFNAIRIGAHFYKEIPPVGTKLYTAPPECRLLTEKEICDAWLYATGYDIENGDSTESRTVHISPDEILEFARIVEGSLGVDHDAQP